MLSLRQLTQYVVDEAWTQSREGNIHDTPPLVRSATTALGDASSLGSAEGVQALLREIRTLLPDGVPLHLASDEQALVYGSEVVVRKDDETMSALLHRCDNTGQDTNLSADEISVMVPLESNLSSAATGASKLEVRMVPLSVVASSRLWSKRVLDAADYERAEGSVSGGRRVHSSHQHPIMRGSEEVTGRCLSCHRETCSPFVCSDPDCEKREAHKAERNRRHHRTGNLCFACWESAAVDVYISHAWSVRAP